MISMTAKTKTKNVKTRRKEFIHALAVFLTADLGMRSIGLEMVAKAEASHLYASELRKWQSLWEASRLFGYPSVEEAERHLMELLAEVKS